MYDVQHSMSDPEEAWQVSGLIPSHAEEVPQRNQYCTRSQTVESIEEIC